MVSAFINDSEVDIRVKNLGLEIERVKSLSPELTYIDCTIEVCERLQIDLEEMRSALPKAIKEKIESEALQMNLLSYKLNTLV